MNTLVLLKQVPDTETHIKISDGKINESSVKWIISPYDEIALEEAIRIREKSGGKVTVVSVGPERVSASLRTAYAMGADDAIHIKADDYQMLDSATIAEAILKATGDQNYEIILCGRQGIDSDNGQVPLIYAAKKNISAIIWARKIEISDSGVLVTCEGDGGEAVYQASYPVVITAQMGMNEPRYPSLKGIMASKKKPIITKNISEFGLNFDKLEIVGYEMPPERPAGRIIDGGSPEEKAKKLVVALHEEIKVI
ncbi:MAG: electron transfer flavoprotein subunit beta/FixA family protein [Spirochaetia bacterium]|nr:electron transfer flavoprotein subunit beta/FixA family protein [Spirochaetia bacterium]